VLPLVNHHVTLVISYVISKAMGIKKKSILVALLACDYDQVPRGS